MHRFTSSTSRLVLATALGATLLLSACASGLPKGRYADKSYLVFVEPQGTVSNLMLEGHDLVTLWNKRTVQKGSAEFQTTYEDAVYYFENAENLAMFKARPAHFAPQFGGHCAYAVGINHLSPAYIATWEIIDDKLYVQHNEKAKRLWEADKAKLVVDSAKNWPGLVAEYGKKGP
jgi:YHS domain.